MAIETGKEEKVEEELVMGNTNRDSQYAVNSDFSSVLSSKNFKCCLKLSNKSPKQNRQRDGIRAEYCNIYRFEYVLLKPDCENDGPMDKFIQSFRVSSLPTIGQIFLLY